MGLGGEGGRRARWWCVVREGEGGRWCLVRVVGEERCSRAKEERYWTVREEERCWMVREVEEGSSLVAEKVVM